MCRNEFKIDAKANKKQNREEEKWTRVRVRVDGIPLRLYLNTFYNRSVCLLRKCCRMRNVGN